jgi:hypothetical protein
MSRSPVEMWVSCFASFADHALSAAAWAAASFSIDATRVVGITVNQPDSEAPVLPS